MKWSDVTIRQWEELQELTSEGLTLLVEQLAILYDKRPEEIRKIKLDQLKKESQKTAFIATLPTAKAVEKFECNGKQYSIIVDLSNAPAGTYIDLVAAVNPMSMADLLAVMTIGEDTTQERSLTFYHHLTVDIAYPLTVFFYRVWTHFTESIAACSVKELNRIISSDIGGGSSPLTISQTETEPSGTTS